MFRKGKKRKLAGSGESEYQVDLITAYRRAQDGTTDEYQIQWMDGTFSWERASNLVNCAEALMIFGATSPKRQATLKNTSRTKGRSRGGGPLPSEPPVGECGDSSTCSSMVESAHANMSVSTDPSPGGGGIAAAPGVLESATPGSESFGFPIEF